MSIVRVAIVTSSFPQGPNDPAGHFVHTEARAMARAGCHVTVIAPGRGPPVETMDHLSVIWVPDGGAFGWPGAMARLRVRPWRLLGAVRYCWAARRVLQRLGPFDRVVAHWIVPNGWPVAAGLPGQIEVVAHGSDVRLLQRLPKRVRQAIVARVLDQGATFRFVSHDLRLNLVEATFPQLGHASSVAACPVDVPVMSREAARRLLGLAPDELWIVIVGRLVASKRADVAVRAAGLVPYAHVAVVGDGPERNRLQLESPNVRFLGLLSRPVALAWIAAADLLVSASRDEGAPTVVREARALGTPVVACPSGDLVAWSSRDAELHVVATH